MVNELARKKMNLSKFGFGLMRRRVASAANRLSSISEEGVATVPLVGWQNPADARGRWWSADKSGWWTISNAA